MTDSALRELVERTEQMVMRLQDATAECSRIAAQNTMAIEEARATAEHARFTANATAAGFTGVVTAHQRIEHELELLSGRVAVLEKNT